MEMSHLKTENMEPTLTEPSASNISGADATSQFKPPVDYDSGIATDVDDGGRDTDKDTATTPVDAKGENNLELTQTMSTPATPTVTEAESESKNDLSTQFHPVKCKITISIAIPRDEEQELLQMKKLRQRTKQMGRTLESPKPQSYYHIEYCLLPDDPEPTKVDVVMFGVAAKVYMENTSKVVKPWRENDKVWLAWSHEINIQVTKDYLMKLISHKITLRIWNTKDKLSAKARNDRPKGFRVPKPEEDSEKPEVSVSSNRAGVKYLVQKQRRLFDSHQPKPSCTIGTESTVHPVCSQDTEAIKTETKPLQQGTEFWEKMLSFAGMQGFLSISLNIEDYPPLSLHDLKPHPSAPSGVKHLKTRSSKPQVKIKDPVRSFKGKVLQKQPPTKGQLLRSSNLSNKLALMSKWKKAVTKYKYVNLKDRQKSRESSAAAEMRKKYGIAMIELDLMALLAGDKSVTSRVAKPSPDVLDAFLTVSVDKSLMSIEQELELNPLIIRIISVTSLPTTPVPVHVLKEKCDPVYCKYKFHNLPPYQSGGREHGTHVYFKDVNVILTGLFSASELQEYLRGPALEIEVHDRDRKIEHQPKKLGLFGTDPDDEKLSNVGLVTSKHTVHNPFGDQKKPWDPYGIAKVDLSELVLGEKCLNVSVPILSCPTPDSRGCYRDGKIAEFATSKDCPQTLPFSSGHYIESNSQIKLRIELPYGLPDKFQTTETETQDYHFSRIICILDYDNTKLSYSLLTEIIAINAEALHLKSYPKYVLEAALSSYKLKPEQKQSLELDIITGFHVLDGAIHLFVLEGLRNKSINRLWEKLQSRSVSYSEKGRLDILYNSDLCFHQRLYADLSVSLCHVCLHEPLSVIVRQPLLYVRDMVPHACFQALSKLDYICQIKKLKEAVQRKLFPSAKMIKLMSREFGVPISYDSIINQKVPPNSAKLPTEKMLPGYSKAKAAQPVIDTYNAKYTEWKQEVGDQMQDHIQNNIDAVHQLNRKLQRPKVETITGVPNDSEQVYNYSSQALNSTEQAKELLRREMAKEPNQRFAYCMDYLSASVDPVDIDTQMKEELSSSKAAWITFKGFRYPGFKSSIESNEHPKMLNEMEIEELRKPWKENILHANILQPVLSRDRWNWNERHADFELYKKPPRFLNFLPPVTKHHAGNDLKPDQFETAHSNDPKCTDTPLVDDKMNVHRRATKTELCTEGSKASNQLDKLQGLLKDAPVKYSLKKPGLVLQSIPALSVMQQSVAEYSSGKVQDKKEVTQAFCPGLYDQHSLKWDKNVIPRYNMKHKMFEELKGANFKVYNCKNPFLYKREVVPLTKEERESTYLFQQSDPPFEPPHPTRNTQRPGNLIQTNTHCGLTFHIS
nr:PREDICTED: uncharacterized protein KIAA1257 homolog [Latimeria chalumnae]|eukprot:XP_006007885.2 PREDICTED: uncharacterized protein KIAA1257 homolog [Latimeria chalumnae]